MKTRHFISLSTFFWGALFSPQAGAEEKAPGQKAKSQTTGTAGQVEEAASEPAPSIRWISRFLHAVATNDGVAEPRVLRTLGDAAMTVPNGLFPQGSTRKSGTPFLRGLGGSAMNPYVTVHHDGVPRLHGHASNLELLDVDSIAFLPGPQGSRFGKNSIGGAIDITSRRPSLNAFGGEFETTFGNYNLYDFRGRVSGPLIKDQLGFSFAGGYHERDGYSENPATGNDLDSRSAWFGKTQFLWLPDDDLEVRFILAGEFARDGGYALNDIRELRKQPRRSAPMDLEGYTERDVIQPTLQVTWRGDQVEVTSVTGYSWWRTEEQVDLDQAAAFPLHPGLIPPFSYFPSEPLFRTASSFLTRTNREEQSVFTQEFRFGSPAGRPVAIRDGLDLSWQAGVFAFHQSYDQELEIVRAPLDYVSPAFASIAGQTAQAVSQMESLGAGLYFEGTLEFGDRFDFSAGLRWDYERRSGSYESLDFGGLIVIGPPVMSYWIRSRDISSSTGFWSPHAAFSWHLSPQATTYLAVSTGSQTDASRTQANWFWMNNDMAHWRAKNVSYEWGLDGRAFKDRVSYGLRLFYTDLKGLGTNAYDPWVNATYPSSREDTAGPADAAAKGLELNLDYHLLRCWQIYGNAAWTRSVYRGTGRTGAGSPVSGNTLPYSPDYTAAAGTLFKWHVWRGLSAYAGADVQFVGPYNYDSLDRGGQEAYSLASFRVGVSHQNGFMEAFVHNAFGTDYVPVAFLQESPYLTGSGTFDPRYAGESGAPTTFGLRVGLRF